MNKDEMKELTASQLVLHEDFKNLTVKDLMEMYNCELEVHSGYRNTIKLKIRCKRNETKLGWNQPIGRPFLPAPMMPPSQPPFDNILLNQTTRRFSESPFASKFGIMETRSEDLDETIKTLVDLADGDEEKSEETSTDKPKVTEPKIKPFDQITIPELKVLSEAYYNNKISLDTIKESWKIGSRREIEIRVPDSDGTGSMIRKVELAIYGYNQQVLEHPINKHQMGLMAIGIEYPYTCNDMPDELKQLFKRTVYVIGNNMFVI